MCAALASRGPDGEGQLRVDRRVEFGHTRLAIQDLSDNGQQPMQSASGRWTVSYNGEIYNFPELRLELEADSAVVEWKSSGDTAVLVAGLEHWGLRQTLNRIEGIFAFAAYDSLQEELFLVRDRVGVKPLFYGIAEGHVVFASRADVVARELSRTDAARTAAASYEFMAYGYVSGTGTIFGGVKQVAPAQLVRVSDCGVTEEWYHQRALRPSSTSARRRSSLQASLAQEIERSVERQLISDAPVGLFLSGGVDSTLVAATAARSSPRPLSSFTVTIGVPETEDARAARYVAEELGLDHFEVSCAESDLVRLFPIAIAAMDQPLADPSIIPTLLVSEAAATKVKVVLTGDGGDELLGGYSRHRWARGLAIGHRFLGAPLVRPLTKHLRLGSRGPERLGRFLGEADGTRKVARLARGLTRLDRGSLYDACTVADPDALSLLCPEPPTALTPYRRWNPRDAVPPGARKDSWSAYMMSLDEQIFLPSSVLAKVDRASMAFGLEARVPLLDERVIGAAKAFPGSWCVSKGRGKLPLRRVLATYEPGLVEAVTRPKEGFHSSFSALVGACLPTYAGAFLSDEALAEVGILDGPTVRSELARWNGAADPLTAQRLWFALVLQAWHFRHRVDT
jgi:asparagine synthase (glutamine-hydrolysing)